MSACDKPHVVGWRDCQRCRGRRDRRDHKMSCFYGKHGSDCDCFVTWDDHPFRRAMAPIGHEFTDGHSGHLMRVTDVGTRTVIVIDITDALARGYKLEELAGPPYSVQEIVWSEYDLELPSATPGFTWDENPMPDPCTALHPHSAEYLACTGPCGLCGKVPVAA